MIVAISTPLDRMDSSICLGEVQARGRRRNGARMLPEHGLVTYVIGRRRRALHIGRKRELPIAIQQILGGLELQNVKICAEALLKGARKLTASKDSAITGPNPASWFAQYLPDLVAERLGKEHFDLSRGSAAPLKPRPCSRPNDTRIIEDQHIGRLQEIRKAPKPGIDDAPAPRIDNHHARGVPGFGRCRALSIPAADDSRNQKCAWRLV